MPLLAYNPTLFLTDSHVATYKIYRLRNPIINEIFYVGQTMQDLQTRLSGHISETGANREKINYIKDIIDKGEKPLIEEVETIHSRCYIEKESVSEREAYWIKHYRGIGCKLLNVANPSSYVYRSYLASLRKGESSYHYYYCGKTVGGYDVYDEKRLLADGLSFPTEKIHYESPYQPQEYNPWENERFIKKIGNKRYSDDYYTYELVYKDEDPNYYDDDY